MKLRRGREKASSNERPLVKRRGLAAGLLKLRVITNVSTIVQRMLNAASRGVFTVTNTPSLIGVLCDLRGFARNSLSSPEYLRAKFNRHFARVDASNHQSSSNRSSALNASSDGRFVNIRANTSASARKVKKKRAETGRSGPSREG